MKRSTKVLLGYGFVFKKTSDKDRVNLSIGFFKKSKPKDIKTFSIIWIKDLTSNPKEIEIK